MMRTAEIRQKYLDFFKSKGHTVVKSDSLIPAGDPTLLFTGAGMNQFKEYFLGIKKDMRRATSVQKCLRTGDLDNVGVTNYHHSFFEMLGNFSFADYFKKEAIAWAWEFLTKDLAIPTERLRVSVHHSDSEAFDIWHKHIGLSKEIIAKLGDKDNFWPSNAPTEGPNGPCGPCSEIFYDQGKDVGCGRPGCSVDCDCSRFAEIWNLVFTQFDRVGVNDLKPLGGKNIDTGMGLERLACVMQGKRSNFEIDIFDNLIAYLCRVTKKSEQESLEVRRAMCAIADHMRAVTFSIADGAYPSNEGRGYVIRKLIRRSVWHGRTLGLKTVFLAPMVELLGKSMGEAYPEIIEHRNEAEQIITAEEKRFLTTLDEGLVKLEQIITETKAQKRTVLSGVDVFKLYDTFGFPDELTSSIAQEHDLSVNTEEFLSLLEEQRLRARDASNISGAIFAISDLDRKMVQYPPTEFSGYEGQKADNCLVLAISADGNLVENTEGIREKAVLNIVLDKTPFYAESGGQVGDKGKIYNETFSMTVFTTKKCEKVYVHEGILSKGKLKVGDVVEAIVDESRIAIRRNHTATHLLQAALREVLGKHVRQFGSEVRADKFRFDFSFQRSLTQAEIKQVEDLVNEKIKASITVTKAEKSIDEATAEGAMALFGEKYGDRVRVVTVGDFSKELCGGTHVDNTKEIDYFKIIKESSISSGTRRIEGMTGDDARAFEQAERTRQSESEQRRFEKESKKKQKSQLVEGMTADGILEELKEKPIMCDALDGVKAFVKLFEGLDKDGLLKVSDNLRQSLRDEALYLLILVGKDNETQKLSAVVTLSGEAVKKGMNAGEIATALARELDGRGGGKANIAFAGGSNMAFDDRALETFTQRCQISR
jgi:alanyl-tRNA synthetase